MAKLKLGALPDDKPVKLQVELPAQVHRDLVAYAEILGRALARRWSLQSWSGPCWRGSWRRIGNLQRRGAQLRRAEAYAA